ncbi:diguanylate cyclase domain-containing protein [Roseibium aggregatum]|uniref:Diguanylate cyclase n=1 Tax=Roseibium aggregatum TaxID=187304 RepID=A0A939EDC3_9HYPH|nr:diguanylate cyclase [Roseibium aggregatum]MBN9669519.1 diguanylate cyclase [Roseibium aggregatum]
MSRPFWTIVLIGAVSLLAFATIVSQILDRQSIKSSVKVFKGVLEDRAVHLADITLDYGYWNETVDNLVSQLDMNWANENFVDYFQEDLHIEGIHVLDGSDKPKFQVIAGKVGVADLSELYGGSLNTLIQEARSGPRDTAPVPATGLIGDLANLYLASAVLVTSYDDGRDLSTDHVLVFAQRMDASLLDSLARRYRLEDLHLSERAPSYWRAGTPVVSHGGVVLGYFIWTPELLGTSVLPFSVLALFLVYLAMYRSARQFFRRATAMVKELEAARRDAVEAKEMLAQQARQDPLTGLGNRRFLDETLSRLRGEQGYRGLHALLYIDLDNFKDINDSYGHETGDLVLQHVADSLRSLKGSNEKVFRLGGDEFIVFLGKSERDRTLTVARTIIGQFSEPVEINGACCVFGASVGVAFSNNPDALLRQADMALYSAKRRGGGQYVVFSANMMNYSGDLAGEKKRQAG